MARFRVLSKSAALFEALVARLESEGHEIETRPGPVAFDDIVLVLEAGLVGEGRRLRRRGHFVFGANDLELRSTRVVLRRAGFEITNTLGLDVDVELLYDGAKVVPPAVIELPGLAFVDAGPLSMFAQEALEIMLADETYVGAARMRICVAPDGALRIRDALWQPSRAIWHVLDGDLGDQLESFVHGDLESWLVDPTYPFVVTSGDLAAKGPHALTLADELGVRVESTLDTLASLIDLGGVARNPKFAAGALDVELIRDILQGAMGEFAKRLAADSPQTSSPVPGPVTELGNTGFSEPAGMDAVSGDNAGDTGPTSAGGPT